MRFLFLLYNKCRKYWWFMILKNKNYFIIIETDDPLKYYFREDSYEDIVELVEDRTGKIMATWHLFQDEFKSGAYKHRFYSINEM